MEALGLGLGHALSLSCVLTHPRGAMQRDKTLSWIPPSDPKLSGILNMIHGLSDFLMSYGFLLFVFALTEALA